MSIGRCCECESIYKKEYDRKNKEKNLAFSREYHKRPEVIEREKQYRKRPDVIEREKQYFNRPEVIERAKQWAKDNPDKINARASKRRAKKKNATPEWIDQPDIKAQIEWFYTEARRLTEETGIEHQVDHVWPLQPSEDEPQGLHVPWNLQILPRDKNNLKSNKLPNDPLGWHLHPDNKNRQEIDKTQDMISEWVNPLE